MNLDPPLRGNNPYAKSGLLNILFFSNVNMVWFNLASLIIVLPLFGKTRIFVDIIQGGESKVISTLNVLFSDCVKVLNAMFFYYIDVLKCFIHLS